MKRAVRPRSRLSRLEHELSAVLGEENLGPLLAITRLRKLWPEIVGPMMAARTEPVRIENLADDDGRRLWVAVDHSIMAQQIRMLRSDILRACRVHARIEGLTQIRTQMLSGAGFRVSTTPPPIVLPLKVRKSLARSLKQVDNTKLRRAMFLARQAQLSHADTLEPIRQEDEA